MYIVLFNSFIGCILFHSIYLEDFVSFKFWYLYATVDSPVSKILDLRRTTKNDCLLNKYWSLWRILCHCDVSRRPWIERHICEGSSSEKFKSCANQYLSQFFQIVDCFSTLKQIVSNCGIPAKVNQHLTITIESFVGLSSSPTVLKHVKTIDIFKIIILYSDFCSKNSFTRYH